MTPPHPDVRYWTADRVDEFDRRLLALVLKGDRIAGEFFLEMPDTVEEIAAWIAAKEAENRFSWRLVKGRMMDLARRAAHGRQAWT